MAFYKVTDNVDEQFASDVNQYADGLTGQADIGNITLLGPLTPPTAPTVAVDAVTGNLTGPYEYVVEFVTGYWHGEQGTGTLIVQGITGYGTASASVSPSGQQVGIGSIPIGPAGTVARVIGRTKSGASGAYYFLTQINDNTTTSWVDNTPDSGLGAQLTTTNTTGGKFVGDGSGLYNLQVGAADITNLLAANTNSGADIALTWDNPTSNDFAGRSVFASTTDISNATYAYCQANATLISSGAGTGSGAADNYVYGVTIGVTYYFKVFALYNSLGSTVESAGVATSLLAQNTTPPGNVTNDSITVGNTQLTITWTDPTDATWAGTVLVRKVGGYPVSQNDGTIVVNSTVRNQYATTGFTDTGLTNGTQYYYQLFPYNTNGYYNTNSANQLTATPENYYTYGVSWNTSTGQVTRIDSAVGLTAPTSFNSLMPWSGMRRCNVNAAGTVTAYYGNAGYSDTTANVMVEIPAFAYKMTTTATGYDFEICYSPSGNYPSGFTVHPAFYRDRTGSGTATQVAYRYFAAYEGYLNGSTLESISGQTPTVSQTMDTFRTDAQAIGNGWGITDFNLLYAIQLLYLIEYASFDSQTLLGQGYTASTNTAPIATGATASLGNASTSGTSATAAMSYRGIENWYGNIDKWIDGYVTSGTSGSTPITIKIGNAAFNDTGSGYGTSYTSTSNWTNAGGYISNIWGVPALGFTPEAFSGSSTSGLYDSGSLYCGYVPIFGGYWAYGSVAGAFDLYVNNSPGSSYSSFGARLAF